VVRWEEGPATTVAVHATRESAEAFFADIPNEPGGHYDLIETQVQP
jgi:hypothetical protein